jgi:hypothetical protein
MTKFYSHGVLTIYCAPMYLNVDLLVYAYYDESNFAVTTNVVQLNFVPVCQNKYLNRLCNRYIIYKYNLTFLVVDLYTYYLKSYTGHY